MVSGSGEGPVAAAALAKALHHAGQVDPGVLLAVGPQQCGAMASVRGLDLACRNWWASLKDKRKGPKARPPRFKRRRGAQSIRFASHVFRTGERALSLGKIGVVEVEPTPLSASALNPPHP